MTSSSRTRPPTSLIRSGHTDGIFQLEGRSTMWGLQDLKPTTIKDVIAAMALFRPATMNTGATRALSRASTVSQAPPLRHALISASPRRRTGSCCTRSR